LAKVGQTRYGGVLITPLHPSGGAAVVQCHGDFFDQLRRRVGALAVFEVAVPLARDAERFGEFFLCDRPADPLRAALVFSDDRRLRRNGVAPLLNVTEQLVDWASHRETSPETPIRWKATPYRRMR